MLVQIRLKKLFERLKMSMINPDYYWWKEITKRDQKIISLTDQLAEAKHQNKILKLQLETINHPLKK